MHPSDMHDVLTASRAGWSAARLTVGVAASVAGSLLSAVGARTLAAQDRPSATAVHVQVAPVLDGRLDDQLWMDVPALAGFVQREPREGTPVSQRTEVRVVQDGDALYIGARLFEQDPSTIVFGQTLRDASLDDADAFTIILDTYRDGQNGFVFATTPAGIEYDGQVTNEGQGGGRGGGRQQRGSGGGFNLNWDGEWEVATSADAEGWSAEVRIPFSTLRYGQGGPQVWGLNFERRIRRNNEEAVWSPLPRQFEIYRVSLAGTLELEAPATRTLTVTPYALAEAFKDHRVAAPEWSTSPKVGGDAKIGLSQSLTLDLTVNTDFALAEVDDQQVNLTRFPLFFPEKRGFFLENAGSFAVGSAQSAELFFSRRIGLVSGVEVPIRAGARLTGKVAGAQIAALNIQTGDQQVLDDDGISEVPLAPPTNFGVVRAFQEFENRSRIGAILVSRLNTSETSDYNLAYGVDGRWGLGQALTLSGWIAGTTTPTDAGAEPRTGFHGGQYGVEGQGTYTTRDWQASFGYRQIGEAFNPEVGFLSRRGYRSVNTRVLRHFRTPSIPWFREFRPHVSWRQFWTLEGFSETYIVHIDNHFAFENGAFFQLPGLNFTGEGLEEPFEIREGIVIPAGRYDNVEWEFRANTDRSAPLSVSGGWEWGGFFTGTRFGPNVTVAYRYRDRFTASIRADYFDVRLDQGDFTTAVVNIRGAYSFTPRHALQANVQYNDDTREVATQLRFGWLDTAGTGLFIVFNEGRHTGPFRETGLRAGPLQRQLVVKYTKLFNLSR